MLIVFFFLTTLCVLAIAPNIEVKPPEETVVAENQPVRISCQVTGKPPPVIHWYKGDQLLIHPKFEIMINGDLYIKVCKQ